MKKKNEKTFNFIIARHSFYCFERNEELRFSIQQRKNKPWSSSWSERAALSKPSDLNCSTSSFHSSWFVSVEEEEEEGVDCEEEEEVEEEGAFSLSAIVFNEWNNKEKRERWLIEKRERRRRRRRRMNKETNCSKRTVGWRHQKHGADVIKNRLIYFRLIFFFLSKKHCSVFGGQNSFWRSTGPPATGPPATYHMENDMICPENGWVSLEDIQPFSLT